MKKQHKSITYAQEAHPFGKLSLYWLIGRYRQIPVCFFAPRKKEITAILAFAKAVHIGPGLPFILDIGCGNGFLPFLFAREGAKVVGIDPNKKLLRNTPFRHKNMELIPGKSLSAGEIYAEKPIDMVINSWMPKGINLTPDILALEPKSIVMIRLDTGETGIGKKSYNLGKSYTLLASWKSPAWPEINGYFRNMIKQIIWENRISQKEFESSKTHSSYFRKYLYAWKPDHRKDGNLTEIWVKRGYGLTAVEKKARRYFNKKKMHPYKWEKELDFLVENRERFDLLSRRQNHRKN